MKRIAAAMVLLAVLGVPAFAGSIYYQFNLAAMGLANADANVTPEQAGWFGFHGGQNVPQGNVNVPFASLTPDPSLKNDPYLQSVPFTIGTSGNSNQSWSGFAAPGGNATVDTPVDLTISTSIAGPRVVFLMMNTFWGRTSESADIILEFANGTSTTFRLSGGYNSNDMNPGLPQAGEGDVRDHNDALYYYYMKNGGGPPTPYWTNSVNPYLHNGKATVSNTACTYDETSTSTSACTPGGDLRVYQDVIALFLDPAYYGETLTQILIRDLGHTQASYPDYNASRLWLWGVTVAAIPEPSTWLLMAGGLGLLAAFRKRR
jgi:hypothetical protein